MGTTNRRRWMLASWTAVLLPFVACNYGVPLSGGQNGGDDGGALGDGGVVNDARASVDSGACGANYEPCCNGQCIDPTASCVGSDAGGSICQPGNPGGPDAGPYCGALSEPCCNGACELGLTCAVTGPGDSSCEEITSDAGPDGGPDDAGPCGDDFQPCCGGFCADPSATCITDDGGVSHCQPAPDGGPDDAGACGDDFQPCCGSFCSDPSAICIPGDAATSYCQPIFDSGAFDAATSD